MTAFLSIVYDLTYSIFMYMQAFARFQRLYEREASQPDEVCLSYTHDRDFVVYKDYPSIDCNPYYQALEDDEESENGEQQTRRSLPWCPPSGFEYPEMLPMDRIIQILREKNEKQVEAELMRIEGCNHEEEDIQQPS